MFFSIARDQGHMPESAKCSEGQIYIFKGGTAAAGGVRWENQMKRNPVRNKFFSRKQKRISFRLVVLLFTVHVRIYVPLIHTVLGMAR